MLVSVVVVVLMVAIFINELFVAPILNSGYCNGVVDDDLIAGLQC